MAIRLKLINLNLIKQDSFDKILTIDENCIIFSFENYICVLKIKKNQVMRKELILSLMYVVSFFFAISFAVVFLNTKRLEQIVAAVVSFLFGVVFFVIHNIPKKASKLENDM